MAAKEDRVLKITGCPECGAPTAVYDDVVLHVRSQSPGCDEPEPTEDA